MANNVPLVNGRAYDYVGINFKILGVVVEGITSINYGTQQPKTNNPGRGTKPVSRGRGFKTYSASITISKTEAARIQAALAPGQDLMDLPPFPITVEYGNGTNTITDQLLMVEFTDQMIGANTGDTNLEQTFNLLPADIIYGKEV